MDGFHDGLDVIASLGAVIHVIGVLVHIEREDRPPAGPGRRVVGRPGLTRRLSWGFHVRSTHPEPPPSALPIAANSARQRSMLPKSLSIASASAGPADFFTESVEIELVQDH